MSYPPYYTYGAQQMYSQQPMMGQAGPSNGYVPLYAGVPAPNLYASATPYPTQPPQVPFIPPTAMLETPPAAQSQSLQTKNRPKNSHRAATTPLPLKSALKKPGAAGATPGPAAPMQLAGSGFHVSRRTNSKVQRDQSAALALQNQAVEPSTKAEECYHMFVTFRGDSEVLLENTLENARGEIERKIFPLWPHGVETQFRGSDWILRFRNAPWNMSGPDVAVAWRLIIALFTLFAERGFQFMTSTKCTTTQPRLVFQSSQSDRLSVFFLAYLSRGGRRISLINPPRHIATAFGPRLRAFYPNQIEVSHDDDILIVESKREIGAAGIKPSHFLMQILKVLMDMEFHLNATVPMARAGPLGLGSRRELLVFKGIPP
ncbi:hypothetical protein MVEN_01542200 [Mycena venus]|uniref:Uncharacterized protein n=1 Tax=Mycena venus TaxID=2733690 RepID=A0A8H7CTV3_9AGAR|nr:hypothetical protein MVEN_01542200 [Mycena venus]